MQKFFCDKCGKEINSYYRKTIIYKARYDEQQREYCDECFFDITHFGKVYVDTSDYIDPRR